MIVLDGKKVAGEIEEGLKAKVKLIELNLKRPPHLVVIIVGAYKASQVYVRNKHRACGRVGIKSTILELPTITTQKDLDAKLRELNTDDSVDAILVQLPLPMHLNSDRISAVLSSAKDADGLTYGSLGYLFSGKAIVKPCTPHGVMRILEHYNLPIEGKHAVVIGRSNIVGKPMALLLTEANATVTICHSKTPNLGEYTREADILVVAAGKPRFLGREEVKKGAVVIDVGIHGTGAGENSGICGDVKFEELKDWAYAATPVPGGVGPMTIAMLLFNTCFLAERKMNK